MKYYIKKTKESSNHFVSCYKLAHALFGEGKDILFGTPYVRMTDRQLIHELIKELQKIERYLRREEKNV